jgi:hypothetical protein
MAKPHVWRVLDEAAWDAAPGVALAGIELTRGESGPNWKSVVDLEDRGMTRQV